LAPRTTVDRRDRPASCGSRAPEPGTEPLLEDLRPLLRRLDEAALAYTAYDDDPDDEEAPLSAEWWKEEKAAVSALRRRWMDKWVASLGDDPQIASYYYRWDASSRNISVMTRYGKIDEAVRPGRTWR
jgi:hypothetical protein